MVNDEKVQLNSEQCCHDSRAVFVTSPLSSSSYSVIQSSNQILSSPMNSDPSSSNQSDKPRTVSMYELSNIQEEESFDQQKIESIEELSTFPGDSCNVIKCSSDDVGTNVTADSTYENNDLSRSTTVSSVNVSNTNPTMDQVTERPSCAAGTITCSTSTLTSVLHPDGLPNRCEESTSPTSSYDDQIRYLNQKTSVASGIVVAHSTPEFLYQLTKMLSENNRDVIEWSNGKIKVHSPTRLETEVLKKYFRHSKFASFQRQLNYFGFRKLAGKGKMAPCSYVNPAAGIDINSLLHIKRKAPMPVTKDASGKKMKEDSQIEEAHSASSSTTSSYGHPVNPILAGIFNRTKDASKHITTPYISPTTGMQEQVVEGKVFRSSSEGANSYQALAQIAAGHGIRHNYLVNSHSLSSNESGGIGSNQQNDSTMNILRIDVASQNASLRTDEEITSLSHNREYAQSSSSILDFHDTSNDSLSQLECNFRNSLTQLNDDIGILGDEDPTPLSQMRANDMYDDSDGIDLYAGFLSHTSSLIDLAMLDSIAENVPTKESEESEKNSFDFIDFPV